MSVSSLLGSPGQTTTGSGLLGFLAGTTLPPNVTSTGSSTTTLPTNITNYEGGAGQTANQLLSTPYQTYQGQMVADPNANQTQAYGLASGMVGDWSPYVQGASNLYGGLSYNVGQQSNLANQYGAMGVNAAYNPMNSWQNQASSWMSPEVSNVVNQIAQAGNQNFETQLLPSINSQFIGSGDFNSLNNMNGLGEGAGLAQQGITSAQANALQQGYTTGMQGYEQQLAQQTGAANNAANAANTTGYMGNYGLGTAASGFGGLGSETSALGTQDLSNLQNTGSTMYGIGQAGINASMGQFNNAQNWTPSMLSSVSGAMSGLPWAGTVSGTSNAPLNGAQYGSSPLAQAATVAGGLGSLSNSLGLGSALSSLGNLGSGYNSSTGTYSYGLGGYQPTNYGQSNVFGDTYYNPSGLVDQSSLTNVASPDLSGITNDAMNMPLNIGGD